MICAWIETSSAETGSSQTISFGSTQRAGDADALALAAREFVRIAAAHARAESPTGSSSSATLRAAPRRRRRARAGDSGSRQRSAPTRHARIERGVGILEDHLHVAAQARSAPSAQRRSPRRRSGPCRAVGSIRRSSSGRASTCRSPIRPRAPASRPALTSKVDAVDGAHRAGRAPARRRRASPGSAWSARPPRAAARSRCDGSGVGELRGASAGGAMAAARSRRSGGGSARAARLDERAARGEAAARRQGIGHVGHAALDGRAGARAVASSRGIEPSRPERVGMLRAREQVASTGARSTMLAGIHDGDAIGASRRPRRDRG